MKTMSCPFDHVAAVVAPRGPLVDSFLRSSSAEVKSLVTEVCTEGNLPLTSAGLNQCASGRMGPPVLCSFVRIGKAEG